MHESLQPMSHMPINYARRLTGRERTAAADKHLGYALAFVAGAANAGGFLAVRQYTSHMTGIVSAVADDLAVGSWDLALAGGGALLSFLLGAMASAVLVNFARRKGLSSEYALPLLLEALLLLCFGLAGRSLERLHALFVPATVMLLCFIMGLQNAVISKLSRSEIRTTHVTGTLTDIGIELGRLVYWNHPRVEAPRVLANRARLRMLATLATSFFVGGVTGAVGFKHVGYSCTVPLAALLVLLAAIPAIDDLRSALAKRLRRG
jgi:uncharacterized membrane protein YoaK (UPF0700 family)